VYFFRVIELAYLRSAAEGSTPDTDAAYRQELPAGMLTPILMLATGVLLLGLLNHTIVNRVMQYALPPRGL
jgi:hypothetical protein